MGIHYVHRTVEDTLEDMNYEKHHLTLICKMKNIFIQMKLDFAGSLLALCMERAHNQIL